MLHLVALLVLGLMCGSELNVALFSHPVLKRQPQETHILVRSSLAALLWNWLAVGSRLPCAAKKATDARPRGGST